MFYFVKKKIDLKKNETKQYNTIQYNVGHVGAHLLEALLAEFPLATLVCLVRSRGSVLPAQRLLDTIAYYELEDVVDLKRVETIAGDLALPKLGMSEADWQMCCESIDCIVHFFFI